MIYFLYKLAKSKKKENLPPVTPGPGDPSSQLAKIEGAKANLANAITKAIEPHTDINPVKTIKEAQEIDNGIDGHMVEGYSGSLYGGIPKNRERLRLYLNQLFDDNYRNNFNWLAPEEIAGETYGKD